MTGRRYPTHRGGRTFTDRGSKRRLRQVERRLTRRELVLAIAGAVALLAFAWLSLASFLKHLSDDHGARRR